jgi:hypothetical protein
MIEILKDETKKLSFDTIRFFAAVFFLKNGYKYGKNTHVDSYIDENALYLHKYETRKWFFFTNTEIEITSGGEAKYDRIVQHLRHANKIIENADFSDKEHVSKYITNMIETNFKSVLEYYVIRDIYNGVVTWDLWRYERFPASIVDNLVTNFTLGVNHVNNKAKTHIRKSYNMGIDIVDDLMDFWMLFYMIEAIDADHIGYEIMASYVDESQIIDHSDEIFDEPDCVDSPSYDDVDASRNSK